MRAKVLAVLVFLLSLEFCLAQQNDSKPEILLVQENLKVFGHSLNFKIPQGFGVKDKASLQAFQEAKFKEHEVLIEAVNGNTLDFRIYLETFVANDWNDLWKKHQDRATDRAVKRKEPSKFKPFSSKFEGPANGGQIWEFTYFFTPKDLNGTYLTVRAHAVKLAEKNYVVIKAETLGAYNSSEFSKIRATRANAFQARVETILDSLEVGKSK